MRKFILAMAMAATAAPVIVATQPAAAQSVREEWREADEARRHWQEERSEARDARGTRDWREEQREAREARRDWQEERHEAQEARRDRNDYRDRRADAGRRDWRESRRYDYNRPDRRYGSYDASRYYRDGRYYQERRLSYNDRIYRGNDGRYYCRRSDGTTGLIMGALAGGLLGNSLDNGRSSTVGTIIGASGGALIGRSIERGEARCR